MKYRHENVSIQDIGRINNRCYFVVGIIFFSPSPLYWCTQKLTANGTQDNFTSKTILIIFLINEIGLWLLDHKTWMNWSNGKTMRSYEQETMLNHFCLSIEWKHQCWDEYIVELVKMLWMPNVKCVQHNRKLQLLQLLTTAMGYGL